MKRLRCLFYTMSVLSEKRGACVDGFVGIEMASALGFEDSRGRCFELADKALPVHLKALHLVHSPSTTAGTKQFFRTIVPATLKLLGATAYRRAHVHTGKSKEEILEKLKACGFFSEGLPEGFGGTWTYDNFSKWQRQRRRVEEEIHLIADVYEQNSQEPKSLCPIPKKPAGSSDAVAPVQEERRLETQKRTMSIVYSRRKREKCKLNVQALQDESTRLTLSNAELERDNDYLEGLLATAEASIARTEHLVPPTIPGRSTQHQAPLGSATIRSGAYPQQPQLGLSTSRGLTYGQHTPLGFTTTNSGMAYAHHPLPGSSSFGNIGGVLGLQRSIEDQHLLRQLARERRGLDSLLLFGQHDVGANRGASFAQQWRQQHGQLQSADFAASRSLSQAAASAPGTFYPAGFSSTVGTSSLPVAQSNPPVGYALQNASRAPLDQHQNHDLHRWLQQQSQNLPGAQPRFGEPPP
jgi:hypothetical protein